jgi:hypothetical protein
MLLGPEAGMLSCQAVMGCCSPITTGHEPPWNLLLLRLLGLQLMLLVLLQFIYDGLLR